jgi:SAM-dependent methyltransferase
MNHPESRHHWSRVYTDKAETAVSWYQVSPAPSLEALRRLGVSPSVSLIDIGGGASNLVDALLEQGWQDVTVLDIAEPALATSKARLGPAADMVQWLVADIANWHPPRRFDVWHDRAVFHFLTAPKDRDAYRHALGEGLAQNGLVIMATFALDGPEMCSGLPVRRYDPVSLSRELGDKLQLIEDWREEHVTPWGSKQSFNWCAFRALA